MKTSFEGDNQISFAFRYSSTPLLDENRSGHEDTAYADEWTQSFTYPRKLPKDTHDSILVSIYDSWCKVVDICARTDEKEDRKEEGSKVEESRHFERISPFLFLVVSITSV